jgi:oligogalacturonide lyase
LRIQAGRARIIIEVSNVTRRQFSRRISAAWAGCLAAGAAALPEARGQFTPIRRFIDPATEAEVLALSDPGQNSYLSHPTNRSSSSRGNFLVFSTETPSGFQALRLDLKGGAVRFLTSIQGLEPRSLLLSPDDRTLYFAANEKLLATPLSGMKDRLLYQATTPGSFVRGLALSEDGSQIVLLDGTRLLAIPTAGTGKTVPRTLAEIDPKCDQVSLSKSGRLLFRDPSRAIYVASLSGGVPKKLPIEGEIGPTVWSPDGNAILFLRLNQGPGKPNSLHEFSLDGQKETRIGPTSQFASFQRNTDSSVFVGASASKAQPFVLLMLRITRRELALCEHKASDPSQVNPVFSPSSQRIYFQSDRLGKSTIFSVGVDRLVEKTETEESAGKKT